MDMCKDIWTVMLIGVCEDMYMYVWTVAVGGTGGTTIGVTGGTTIGATAGTADTTAGATGGTAGTDCRRPAVAPIIQLTD